MPGSQLSSSPDARLRALLTNPARGLLMAESSSRWPTGLSTSISSGRSARRSDLASRCKPVGWSPYSTARAQCSCDSVRSPTSGRTANLIHIPLDNQCTTPSAGSAPWPARSTSPWAAAACGYAQVHACCDLPSFSHAIKTAEAGLGPTFIHLPISPGSLPGLATPARVRHHCPPLPRVRDGVVQTCPRHRSAIREDGIDERILSVGG